MIIHTAAWQLSRVTLACGHALSVRADDRHAWCSWCARTVRVGGAA